MNPILSEEEFDRFLSTLPKSKIKLFLAINWLLSIEPYLVDNFISKIMKLPNRYFIMDK